MTSSQSKPVLPTYGRHTPGPWEWVEDRWNGGFSGLVGPDGAEVLFPNTRNEGDTGVAWFEDFPAPEDARLIAAAPELLEALTELTDAAAKVWSDPFIRGAVDRARAAIAKATGA